MIGKENRVHLPMIFRGAMCSEAAKTLPFQALLRMKAHLAEACRRDDWGKGLKEAQSVGGRGLNCID